MLAADSPMAEKPLKYVRRYPDETALRKSDAGGALIQASAALKITKFQRVAG
jgi:hypothetical protein